MKIVYLLIYDLILKNKNLVLIEKFMEVDLKM
jgi:hypothetical protein